MRTTCLAGIWASTSLKPWLLALGLAPSINTLPPAPPKPRRSEPSSIEKPGTFCTMSSADCGLKPAKKAGS